MVTAAILGGLLGLGLWLIITGLPVTRPRLDLALALRRLSAQGRMELEAEFGRRGPALFKSPALERLLRPVLEDAGSVLSAFFRRTGIAAPGLERRLARAWPGMTPGHFYGEKLASGLVFMLLFPSMNLLGISPFGQWPAWLWLAGFWAGFALPDWMVEARLHQRRTAVLIELPAVLDLLAIAGSSGMSPEQSLLEVSRQLDGTLAQELRGIVRDAGLGLTTHARGLRDLAEREDLAELVAVADAWQSSIEQGLPLGQSMLTLAETVRERKRVRMLEEGGKSTIRMLFPVALFIFPVFLVVLLYPAGMELLGLGG